MVENDDFFSRINGKLSEMQKFLQPDRSLHMYVDMPGLFDTIIYIQGRPRTTPDTA